MINLKELGTTIWSGKFQVYGDARGHLVRDSSRGLGRICVRLYRERQKLPHGQRLTATFRAFSVPYRGSGLVEGKKTCDIGVYATEDPAIFFVEIRSEKYRLMIALFGIDHDSQGGEHEHHLSAPVPTGDGGALCLT